MEKIRFQLADGTVEEFFIEEQTRIGGVSYLLVSDSMEDEASAYILKDVSKIQIRRPAMKCSKMRTNCRLFIKFLNKCLKTWILKCKKHTIRNRRH